MKLGLIQCDYVPTLLQSSFKDYPVMFEKAFNSEADYIFLEIGPTLIDINLLENFFIYEFYFFILI